MKSLLLAQYKIDSGDTEAAALMLEEIHKAEV